MVRFSTKTLLFAFVLVALWFSTFSGYAAGRDVRASLLLIAFLTAGCAAVYSRGKGRAFWAGFFAVMLLSGGNVFEGPVNKYIPSFNWLTQSYDNSSVTLQYAPAASVVYSAPTTAAPQSVTQFIAAPRARLRPRRSSPSVGATRTSRWRGRPRSKWPGCSRWL